MTDRPIIFSAEMVRALLDGRKTQTRRLAWRPLPPLPKGQVDARENRPSNWQYVHLDDRLWVREAWRIDGAGSRVSADACRDKRLVEYRADGYAPERYGERSPIHMPRWASRITLHVEAVRVERSWDMTEADAIAEGVTPSAKNLSGHPLTPHLAAFSDLWLKLHGYTTWATNTEVVVLQFRVAKGNIDA